MKYYFILTRKVSAEKSYKPGGINSFALWLSILAAILSIVNSILSLFR